MKTKIFCRTTGPELQSFYLRHEGVEYFLFTQSFRRSVKDYYRRGVAVDQALSHPRAGDNHALRKVMEKLPAYIRYIEKEYGVTVLDQTRRREDRKRNRNAPRWGDCQRIERRHGRQGPHIEASIRESLDDVA